MKFRPYKTAAAGSLKMGDAARDAGRWQEAIDAYAAHLRASPHDFGILVQLGNCAKEARDFATSQDAYQRAFKINPDDADLNLQLGHLHKVAGRRREAARSYLRALQVDGSLVGARRELEALRNVVDNDFSLPANGLDLIEADDLDTLIVEARRMDAESDPFRVYGNLISTR